MGVFHQLGYQSSNLLDLPQMSSYAGAIISPVNCDMQEAESQIIEARGARQEFQIILDSQFYYPGSQRGKLPKWDYFPKDVDTADQSSDTWWDQINSKLAERSVLLKVDAVCSPAVIPKQFSSSYFSQIQKVSSKLFLSLTPHKIQVLQTVVARLSELGIPNRPMEIASIVSREGPRRVYLVLEGPFPPRRELADVDGLVGAMRLIDALERNGISVLVAFCSADLLLWKAAGACDCASGKFFNLRRFTPQRFHEEGDTGGGQLPYWFEESLLAFLRQADIRIIRKQGLLSNASQQNPFCTEILQKLEGAVSSGKKPKWLGTSWRQFLYWFSDVESRLSSRETTAEAMLLEADKNWAKLQSTKALLEDRMNDGSWVRHWLNAVREYSAPRE